MGKLEINEENYELYQQLMNIRKGVKKGEIPLVVEIVVILGSCFLTVWGMLEISDVAMMITEKIGPIFPISLNAIDIEGPMTLGHFAIIGFFVYNVPKICKIIKTQIFHKKHPNLDIKIDTKELGDALEKYMQLSKIPKDIETQKEGHLETQNESFREMSVEERLEFLKQEQEFWKQVAIQEKYQDIGEETTGQVGVGQVNNSENEGKVKHI